MRYGQHQASVFLELECRPKRKSGVFRLAGDYTQRFGGRVDKHLHQGAIQASYVWDKREHFGAFVRQHVGYDYYNINFQNGRPFLSFGVMWDIGRLDSLSSGFRRATDPPTDPTVAVDGCHPLR